METPGATRWLTSAPRELRGRGEWAVVKPQCRGEKLFATLPCHSGASQVRNNPAPGSTRSQTSARGVTAAEARPQGRRVGASGERPRPIQGCRHRSASGLDCKSTQTWGSTRGTHQTSSSSPRETYGSRITLGFNPAVRTAALPGLIARRIRTLRGACRLCAVMETSSSPLLSAAPRGA
jgi:hypothetical protein